MNQAFFPSRLVFTKINQVIRYNIILTGTKLNAADTGRGFGWKKGERAFQGSVQIWRGVNAREMSQERVSETKALLRSRGSQSRLNKKYWEKKEPGKDNAAGQGASLSLPSRPP